MSDLSEADFGTALYRSRDSIQNIRIKIRLERVTSTNVIPQAELEKEAGRTVEMQDMQEKNFGSQRDSEEYTFKWQEKVFSKREVDQYSNPGAFDTGLSRKYHNEVKAVQEIGRHSKRLFSYVDHDSFTKHDGIKKMTTSPDEEPTTPAEKMSNIRHRRGAGKKYGNGNYIAPMKVVENKPTEDLMKANRMYTAPVQTMYIMADLSQEGKQSTEDDEFVLCTVKFDTNGVLIIRPDFNKGRKAYKVEAAAMGRDIFEYTVEHLSAQLTRQEQERESKMLRELYNRHADFLQSCVGHEFEPPTDMLRVMVNGEIESAKNFENDDLFVSYFVDLPSGWYAPSSQHLSGVTHTCSTKRDKRDDVAYFSFPFSFELFYKDDSSEKDDGTIHWPVLYVEVSSLDSWQRYRTEGYSYTTLPTTAGRYLQELNCWRPKGRSTVSELRRFFVGGNAELEDPTYAAVPSTYEGTHLSKYGFRTISTGSVKVHFHMMQQSQTFLQSQTSKKKMGTIIDRLGKSAGQVNIMNVLEAFQRARKRMVLARDNLKKEYIDTLKALEVEGND